MRPHPARAATRHAAMHDFLASIPSNAEGCAPAPLDDFLVISASGADALTFLHGQLTQDVTGLPADAAAWPVTVAWLLMGAPPRAATTRRSCALLRQDLSQACSSACPCSCCAPRPSWRDRVAPAAWPDDAQLAALEAGGPGARPGNAPSCRRAPGSPRPRRLANGWWWIASTRNGRRLRPGRRADADGRRRLARGRPGRRHPWIGAATQDLFIPQTVNLELIQGVSFTKGCYPGQGSGGAQPLPRHGQAPHGSRPRRGRRQEARWRTSMCDAAQPDEPVGRVIDAARHAGSVSASRSGRAARLGAADGPRIAVAPLPYSIQPE